LSKIEQLSKKKLSNRLVVIKVPDNFMTTSDAELYKMNSEQTESLAIGFLNQFSSLKQLESSLEQLLLKQHLMIKSQDFRLDSLDSDGEISLMVSLTYKLTPLLPTPNSR
jgi:hypothetical protein